MVLVERAVSPAQSMPDRGGGPRVSHDTVVQDGTTGDAVVPSTGIDLEALGAPGDVITADQTGQPDVAGRSE
jgi:hypothetical protein